jgi:hypothetical protein
MVPSKVTPPIQLAAHYFMLNWASDQNKFRSAVMVAMVATVIMGAATKLETATATIAK